MIQTRLTTLGSSGGSGGGGSIGGAMTGGTDGSVLFIHPANTIAQDNSNFFWDATNHRLGIGMTAPTALLSLNGGTTAALGINLGDSTANLYRSSSGLIATDGSFQVGGNLTVNGGFIATPGTMNLGTNGSNGNIVLTPNGTGCTILNGKVGIGTATPGTGLIYGAGLATTVHASASAGSVIANQSSGGYALFYAEANANAILALADTSAATNFKITDIIGSSGKMVFRRVNDAYSMALAQAMTIDYTAGDNSGYIGIGTASPTSPLTVNWTFPTSISGTTVGTDFVFTTAGNSNQLVIGTRTLLNPGYTGANATIDSYVVNTVAGTGTSSWILGAANYGTSGQTFGITTGHNVGNSAAAGGSSSLNLAGYNTAFFATNSPAINVGSASLALNATTNVGGFFGLMATAPTLTSAALIADNGAVAAPIFIARDNGTAKFTIADGGTVNIDGLTASQTVGTDGSKNLISISTPIIVGNDRKTAQTAAVSLATYTVGAADTSYQISANVNVTAFAVGTFNIQVAYTDETNTAQTLKLNFSSVTGTIGLAIAATGPFEGIPAHIRAKAGSTIIVSSTGTFTSLTYNLEERIVQE